MRRKTRVLVGAQITSRNANWEVKRKAAAIGAGEISPQTQAVAQAGSGCPKLMLLIVQRFAAGEP